MKNLFQSKATLFFLHQNAQPQSEGLFDVILSPQFYWVKKTELPVKKVSEAKKLAESVFEGSLPEGDYSYEVVAAEDGPFILIAYNREEVSEKLQHYFTDKAKIQSVRFAQYECAGLDECCSIDDGTSLVNLNGLLMQIPRNCTDPRLTMDGLLSQIKLSSHKVKLGSLDVEIVDKRTFVYLAASFVLFLSAFVIEYADYKQSTGKLEEAKSALIRKYDLPPTTMQLNSIKNRLYKTFQTQKKIREALYALSKLSLGNKEYIKFLDINDKIATLEIALSDAAREGSVKNILRQKFKILESDINENILKVKIAV